MEEVEIGFTFGRFLASLVISTAVGLGGVYTIVGLAISGMTSAIDATNSRMSDIDGRISRLEDRQNEILDELRDIQVEIRTGFKQTQEKIERKAQLENPTRQFAASSLFEVLKAAVDRNDGPKAFFLPNRSVLEKVAAGSDPASNPGVVNSWLSSLTVLRPTDGLLETVKRDGPISLVANGGKGLTAFASGDNLLVKDDEGTVAKVLSEERLPGDVTVYTVDKVLNYEIGKPLFNSIDQ